MTEIAGVILDEDEINRLYAELDQLVIQRNAADARIAEITEAIVASEEARKKDAQP